MVYQARKTLSDRMLKGEGRLSIQTSIKRSITINSDHPYFTQMEGRRTGNGDEKQLKNKDEIHDRTMGAWTGPRLLTEKREFHYSPTW